MKQKGGKDTPKTLVDLRRERRKLQSELEQVKGLARQTRLRSVHAVTKRRSERDLEERINDINFELEQRNKENKEYRDSKNFHPELK